MVWEELRCNQLFLIRKDAEIYSELQILMFCIQSRDVVFQYSELVDSSTDCC